MIIYIINGMKPTFVIICVVPERDELAGVVVGKIHGNVKATQVKTLFFEGNN